MNCHLLTRCYKCKCDYILSRGQITTYEGDSICNENPFITPSINALGFYAICQKKDQSVAVKMVHKTLFYLSKFNKLQTFKKHTNTHCIYFPPNCKDSF